VDGIAEIRGGTISTFNGPPPEILVPDSAVDEIKTVSQWLMARTKVPDVAPDPRRVAGCAESRRLDQRDGSCYVRSRHCSAPGGLRLVHLV
jgi:hypothetical protein